MNYANSDAVIRIGDKVQYAGTPGRIVFVIDDDCYADAYPREQWSYLGSGIGLELQDGTLYHFTSVDEEEDLELVQ